jgi:beta-barrel assembly-enhancing protease
MNKKQLILFLLVLIWTLGQAQISQNSFTTIESQGKIPKDFGFFAKYKKNPLLQKIFTSGLLVYGSELNEYIEKVADLVMKDDPELRKKMRFYVLKSPVVNAYAFSEHVIIITTGLIAQLENESELAFIISHELVHITNKHIEKQQKIKRNKNQGSVKKDYLSYHNRSREHEYEADSEGFKKFFEKSGYSLEAVNGVYDLLQYSYLPYDEIKFTRDFVETDYYQFPNSYFLTNVSRIRSREDYIDTLSTHPNILRRRNILNSLVSKSDAPLGSFFIQNEEQFHKIKNMARYETINTFLTNHDYGNSMYNSYVLLQNDPNNPFLNRALIASMYGLCKHKYELGLTRILGSYKEVEGEKQQLYYFLSTLSRDELYLLTLRFAYQAWKKFPENPYYEKVCVDLIYDLHKKKKLNYTDYSDYPMGINVDTIQVVQNNGDTIAPKGRYDKIKTKKNNTKVIPTEKFKVANYMLVGLRKDSVFMDLVEKKMDAIEDEETLNQVKTNAFDQKLCPSMILWEPKTYKLKNEYWVKDNKGIESAMKVSVKKHQVDGIYFDKVDLTKMTTELYNHYAKIQAFYNEYSNSDNLEMIYYQSLDIEDACTAFGGSCINFISCFSETEYGFISDAFSKVSISIMSGFFAPTIPIQLFVKEESSQVSYVVINLVTGEKIVNESAIITGRNNTPAVKNFVYKMYYKHAPKKGEKR